MSAINLREEWTKTIEGEGGHCPVCDRWGRIYARNINRTMARSFIWLCQTYLRGSEGENGPLDWVDVPKDAPRWVVRSNQLPTLAWWGLVERCPKDLEGKAKYSGMWRPTTKGLNFYWGEIKVPEKVYTYNNQVEDYSAKLVSLPECFEDTFDYEATMQERFDERNV